MNLVHMFKRFGEGMFVLMFVCLFSICGKTEVKAATSTYYETIDGIKWTAVVSTDGTVAVKPYSKSTITGDVTIPDTVAGYTVSAICSNAFGQCTNLTGVEIPDGITTIGECAFYKCTNLTQVTIPPNVSEIGQEVFQNTGLTSVTIPSNVKSLGWEAFINCTSLSTVTIESGLETVGKEAFAGCTSLTNITLPDSVTSFGGAVFRGCSNFTEINVDSANQYFTSKNGVLFDKTETTLICYPYGKTSTYEIPEGVERIENYAFYQTKIPAITMPSTLTSIGAYAFYRCGNLGSIAIISNITEIGNEAFESCSSLSRITVDGNIDAIGKYSFHNCDSLTDFSISGRIGRIGDYAFFSCNEIETISLPEGLTSIGVSAFSYCYNLNRICIPSTVTSIGKFAFYITDIQEITVAEANQNYCAIDNVLFDKNVTELVLCSNAKSGYYEIPDGVTIIDEAAFYKCENLTSVGIPDGVTTIQTMAFFSCTSLTAFTIPEGIETIDGGAFQNCENLTSITIPEGITSISAGMFWGCTGLTNVTIPDSVESIEDNAFFQCSSLTSITIPDGVSTIKCCAFEGCTNLKSIVIPGSVWTMEDNAFGYSEEMNIETVYYMGNKLKWDSLIEEDSPLRNSSNIYYIGAQIVTDPVSAQYKNSQVEATELTVEAIPGEDKDGNEIGTLTYQWYVVNEDCYFEDAVPIENATESSYTPELVAGMKYYYCVVTNTYNGITAHMTSDLAMIYVGYY